MIKIINFILIFQLILSSISYADDENSYESKKCKLFFNVSEVEGLSEEVQICKEGSQVNLAVPKDMFDLNQSTSRIIDEILLQKILPLAQKRMSGFDVINTLPESKEKEELIEEVNNYKKILLPTKKNAIHQIRTILTLYPDIERELITQDPSNAALICKYNVWRHRREILGRVATISSKIVSLALIVGSLTASGAVVFGAMSASSLGPLMIALGAGQTVAAGFEFFATVQNWDDVRAGRWAKARLEIDDNVKKKIKELEKDPANNQALIDSLQSTSLLAYERKELKELNKVKNKRIKTIVTSSIKAITGILAIYGGASIKDHFKDFKTTEPAKVINPLNNSPGSGTLPGSGGNDPGSNGFLTNDGG